MREVILYAPYPGRAVIVRRYMPEHQRQGGPHFQKRGMLKIEPQISGLANSLSQQEYADFRQWWMDSRRMLRIRRIAMITMAITPSSVSVIDESDCVAGTNRGAA